MKHIPDEIIDILRASEWHDGNLLKLTCGQLPRDTYVKVDKVLKALGGKWNRKLGGHSFSDDVADELDAAISAGKYTDSKQELGFFETPDWLADEVVQLAEIGPEHTILEPSAGSGQLIRAIARIGDQFKYLHAIEIDRKREVALLKLIAPPIAPTFGRVICEFTDFLRFSAVWESEGVAFDRIIMNPPYSRQQDVDHVTAAFKLLSPGGRLVALMSAGWTFRENAKSVVFRKLVERHGHYKTNECGAFKESGTMVNTVMVVLNNE